MRKSFEDEEEIEDDDESAAADADSDPEESREGRLASDEADAAAAIEVRYVMQTSASGKHEIIDTKTGEVLGSRARARDAKRYAESLNEKQEALA